MLTGLLFGQDVLILNSGEVYNGTFIEKVGLSSIVFQVEGENDSTKFPMKDVAMIKTSDGELTYPFDVPKIANDIPTTNERHETLNYSVTNSDILLAGVGLCCLVPAVFILVMLSYESSGSGCGQ